MLCSGRKLSQIVSDRCVESMLSNELGYLAEEISKQSAESVAWFLDACIKMQEETHKLRQELLKLN